MARTLGRLDPAREIGISLITRNCRSSPISTTILSTCYLALRTFISIKLVSQKVIQNLLTKFRANPGIYNNPAESKLR